MTKVTWKTTVVLIIIAGGIATLLFSFVSNLSDQESTKSLQDPSAFQLMSLQSVLPQGLKLANKWRDDAYLFRAVFSVYPETSNISSTVVLFFGAKNAPVTYYISFWDIDGERKVKVEEDHYDESLNFSLSPKIDIEGILMDSIQAFGFLHLNGGSDFVSKYGDKEFYVTLTLEPKSSTKAQWRAYYRLEPGPGWHFEMNAYTNELLAPTIYE